jgi:hypothetical protein
MHASSCVGRYDGQWLEGDCHGRGVFTSAQGGWTYSVALERDRPTEGELVEADGHRFKVAYAKDCAFIFSNPKPKSKVGVVWCVVLRRRSCLRCARVRVRQRACAVLGTA